MAIAALVLGIGALLFALIPVVGYASVPFAIAAIALGVMGMNKAKTQGGAGKGLAIGGLVTGVLALLVSLVWTLVLVLAADDIEEINSDPSDGECNEERVLQDPDC
ncbi:DUF4190 domain-containing protein [Iamia sp.]|uniref:DUF4190 domain-containing protein n=1 Tax=Iamia sp. TaxID=2722710 RepID=UPI002BB99D71|nr:DUF4190 domain-containing protein [Iamia sp.]HXH56814.1 DUF4190 domain-containing protein [Iamia sp.]